MPVRGFLKSVMVHKSFAILPFLFLPIATAPLCGQQAQPSADAKATAPAVSAPAAADAVSSSAPKSAPKPAPKKEDWSVLRLEGSGLDFSHPGAVQIAKWDKGDATEELLRAEWRNLDPIDLYVVRPKGVEKPPVILYLYDYSNEADRFRNERWCRQVTKDGFAAVGFVSAVSEDRIHLPRPIKEWFVSELQESLGATTHDVQMILNYLDKRGDMDMSRIGMFGQGSGASIAVLAAAADPRVKALELFNPWGDWPDWLKESPAVPEKERANYLKPEFLAKVAKLEPVLYLPQLESRNVRIEYILDDEVTPKTAREAMLAAAPKTADIARFKDTGEHAKAFHVYGLAGWIRSQLQPGPLQTPAQPKADPAPGVASNRH
jgi:hypothetical protein